MSQAPRESESMRLLKTFGTEDIGDTPSSPCFVIATPNAAKYKLMINNVYLSFFDISMYTPLSYLLF